jgi:hypothetical protein
VCLAQSSSIPATRPTELPIAAPAPAPVPAAYPAHPAKVVYAQGQLAVTADNSSLNQVLREIARETGMKITGGVGDERVYGTYGPGPPASILTSLLDGTGSNMLLRENASDSPAELILTPREGGPTPPNPNAPGFDDEAAEPAVAAHHSEAPPVQPPMPPEITPSATSPGPLPVAYGVDGATPAVAATPTDSAANPQPASGAEPQSPNGVKTPQQIYQQLQQLQQQQQSHP